MEVLNQLFEMIACHSLSLSNFVLSHWMFIIHHSDCQCSMLNPSLYKANNNNIPQSMEVRMEMTLDKNLNYKHSTHFVVLF